MLIPSIESTSSPSDAPTRTPFTLRPTLKPTRNPTRTPSSKPSSIPSFEPTTKPTWSPTLEPYLSPSVVPTHPTYQPSPIQKSPLFLSSSGSSNSSSSSSTTSLIVIVVAVSAVIIACIIIVSTICFYRSRLQKLEVANLQSSRNNEHSVSISFSDTNRDRDRDTFGNPLSQEEMNKLSVQRIPSAPVYSSELEFHRYNHPQVSEGVMIGDQKECLPIATAVAYPTTI